MKKILFTLCLLVLFTNKCFATEYSEWQEEEIVDESLQIETETRYRFYREEEVGEFLVTNNGLYDYVMEDNYYYETYDDYDNMCPSEFVIDKVNVYPYSEVEKTGYIYIGNNDKKLLIDRIKIYYDKEEIKYSITYCDKCDLMFFTLDAGGIYKINLNNKLYDTSKLSIDIATNNMEISNYQIIFYNDNLLKKKTASTIASSNIINYSVDPSWLKDVTYSDLKYSSIIVEKNPFNIIYYSKLINKCKIKYTYYYNIYREYYDDNYYVYLEDDFSNEIYIKDIDDYKVFYRYKISKDDYHNDNKVLEENIDSDFKEESIDLEDDYYIDNNMESNNGILIDNTYDESVANDFDITIENNSDNDSSVDSIPETVDIINTLNIKNNNYSKIFLLILFVILFFVGSLIIIKKNMSK